VYSIEPSFTVNNELARLILKAGTMHENKCFFTDGAFCCDVQLERLPKLCYMKIL